MKKSVLGLFLTVALVWAAEDLFAEADRYLVEFVATVETALFQTTPRLDYLEEQALYTTSSAVWSTDAFIEDLVRIFEVNLEEIRNASGDANRDLVEQCISLHSQEMRDLPNNTKEVILECIHDLAERASTNLQTTRTEAYHYLVVADQLKAEIDGCRLVDDDEQCISRVIIEIFLQTLEAPVTIKELERRAEDILWTYMRAIPDCTQDRFNNVAVVANIILSSIQTCIDIGFKTST